MSRSPNPDEILKLARLNEKEGNYTQSADLYRNAAALFGQKGKFKKQVEALLSLAQLLDWYLSDYEGALSTYQEALGIMEERDLPGRCRAFYGMAVQEYFLGHIDDALVHSKEALKFAETEKDDFVKSLTYTLLGDILVQRGKLEEAQVVLESSKKIAERKGWDALRGRALSSLGLLYAEMGELDLAKLYLKEAIEVAEEVGDRSLEGTAYVRLGITYLIAGQDYEAREWLNRGKKIAEETGMKILKEEAEDYLEQLEEPF